MDRRQDIDIKEEKKRLRREALDRRDSLSAQERREKSRRIMERLLAMPCYQQAASLLGYVSYQSEVETEELLLRAIADGKRVYCPKVDGKRMEFYRIDSLEDLAEGFRGIREPAITGDGRLFSVEQAAEEREKTCMAIPGAAFDMAHNRIGYGGGYYDRYLERCACLLDAGLLATAAVAYRLQLVEQIPCMEYDRRVEFVVTE